MKTMDLCQLWLRCRCIILIRTILVLNRTLFFRIVWTLLPTRRSSPSWKNSHRVILLWWWLTEMGPFEPLSVKCSQTHWWQCAGFTANMLVKDTWVSIPLVRTLPYSHYFLFVSGKLKSQFPHIFKEILEDLEQFRNYVIDQEMFNVIWALLERKYEEEYDYPSEVAKSLTLDFLIRYFKKTYVTSKTLNGFWQGFIPLTLWQTTIWKGKSFLFAQFL